MDSERHHTHEQGIVVKKNIGSYHVHSTDRVVPCAISARLRKQLVYPLADPTSLHPVVREVKILDRMDLLAVGDAVKFLDTHDGGGLITEVLPRRNRLVRRDPYPGTRHFEQVIVANIDHMVAVFAAAQPTPKWAMLDRYLVSAESLGLHSLVAITKLDLVRASGGQAEADTLRAVDLYRQIGYPVMLTSSVTGEGVDDLRQVLKGCVSVLVGKSGVGKTALMNAIEPGLGLRIGEVGQGSLGKGKHTTSAAELITTSFGADIVDTPGMREFGLSSIKGEDLAWCFPEMRPFVGLCKFGLDCSHIEEPGCAIRRQVMAGDISPSRYKSYLRLSEEA